MFLLAKEKRLKVVTNTRATGVILKKGSDKPKISGIYVSYPGIDKMAIESRITIDATGTGVIAILSGCHSMYGRDAKKDFKEEHAPKKRDNKVQQCTWMYISQQLGEGTPFNMMKLDNVNLGVHSVNSFAWFHTDPDRVLKIKPRVYLHWGCAVNCKDTRDPLEIAKTQKEALKIMEHDHRLLRENNYAVYLAPKIGIREVNRIVGEYVITESYLKSGILSSDTIALGDYGLDVWGENLSRGASRTPLYGIPYRALIPRDVDGLLLAGKAISGTHIAMSAYRVMPIVGSIGQSAGVAAALCIKQKLQPREVNPLEVKKLVGIE